MIIKKMVRNWLETFTFDLLKIKHYDCVRNSTKIVAGKLFQSTMVRGKNDAILC
jgi:hypothetical protein